MEVETDKRKNLEIPIQPGVYPVIDNDLARDNIENDIPAADLEDFRADPRGRSGDKPLLR